MEKFTAEDARQLYGIDNWGAGYFDVSSDGDFLVLPTKERVRSIRLRSVVDSLVAEGCSLPVLLRFPEILATQVGLLRDAFAAAIREFGYGEGYYPVYPIKVNQQRSVVEEILRAGASTRMGLEVGSKTELMVALTLPVPVGAFISCSGFKDSDYIEQALHGRALGKNVVIVIERMSELRELILCGMAEEPTWPSLKPSVTRSCPAMSRSVLAKLLGPAASCTSMLTMSKSRLLG